MHLWNRLRTIWPGSFIFNKSPPPAPDGGFYATRNEIKLNSLTLPVQPEEEGWLAAPWLVTNVRKELAEQGKLGGGARRKGRVQVLRLQATSSLEPRARPPRGHPLLRVTNPPAGICTQKTGMLSLLNNNETSSLAAAMMVCWELDVLSHKKSC